MLISDLLADDDLPVAIRAGRGGGHDLVVLHVMDSAEREFPFSSEALFVDLESGSATPAVPAEVRAAYHDTVRRVVEEWRVVCAQAGADYALLDTAEAFGISLRKAFARRERLP